jgi:hypothetical protein
MTDQEEQSLKEAERLSKKQVKRKANIDREQAIQKDLKARYAKESEKRAAEESRRLVKDQARRKAYLAKEQAMAEARKARKPKDNKYT